MQITKTILEMKTARRQLAGPVGFVPTMGFLHEGHLTLVRRAKSENQSAVASIFVNPTQFGPREDFAKYPRNTQRDLAMLESVGTGVVFMPEPEDMYPAGFGSWVEIDGITAKLEGASRPSHFRGVATVVAKLFNIVEPQRAYFGQKDAQQVLVVRKMAAELNMNLDVIVVPTLREPDGLAMSSRNVYLDPEERKAATILFKSIELARRLWQNGERDAGKIRSRMIELIRKEPRAQIDYVSIADTRTLQELNRIEGQALISMAVRIGKTRLIDNTILDE